MTLNLMLFSKWKVAIPTKSARSTTEMLDTIYWQWQVPFPINYIRWICPSSILALFFLFGLSNFIFYVVDDMCITKHKADYFRSNIVLLVVLLKSMRLSRKWHDDQKKRWNSITLPKPVDKLSKHPRKKVVGLTSKVESCHICIEISVWRNVVLVEMSADILCPQKQADADIGCIYQICLSPNSIPRLLNFHETKKNL